MTRREFESNESLLPQYRVQNADIFFFLSLHSVLCVWYSIREEKKYVRKKKVCWTLTIALLALTVVLMIVENKFRLHYRFFCVFFCFLNCVPFHHLNNSPIYQQWNHLIWLINSDFMRSKIVDSLIFQFFSCTLGRRQASQHQRGSRSCNSKSISSDDAHALLQCEPHNLELNREKFEIVVYL